MIDTSRAEPTRRRLRRLIPQIALATIALLPTAVAGQVADCARDLITVSDTIRIGVEQGKLQVARIGDLEGDGIDDVVALTYDPRGLEIFAGIAHGEYAPPRRLPFDTAGVTGFELADLDANGRLDLVVSRAELDRIEISLEDRGSELGFAPPIPLVIPDGAPGKIYPVHFDGDDRLDLVVLCSRCVAVILGEPGGFRIASITPSPQGRSVSSSTLADIDGDGHDDLVVLAGNRWNFVAYSINDGAGGFLEPVVLPFELGDREFLQRVTALDVDDDGDSDLVVSKRLPEAYRIIRNDGGDLVPRDPWIEHGIIGTLNTGDVDGDGRNDLNIGVDLLLNSGDATLREAEIVGQGFWGWNARESVLHDIDRDGFADRFTYDSQRTDIRILLSLPGPRTDGPFQLLKPTASRPYP